MFAELNQTVLFLFCFVYIRSFCVLTRLSLSNHFYAKRNVLSLNGRLWLSSYRANCLDILIFNAFIWENDDLVL